MKQRTKQPMLAKIRRNKSSNKKTVAKLEIL